MEPKKIKKFDLYSVFIALAVLLGIILLINIFYTFSLSSSLKKNIELNNEKSRPARIELTVIKNSKCADCFDTLPIVSHIKTGKVNITNQKTLEFDSSEGKALIIKYGIAKVPSIIITGEIDKSGFQGQGFDKKQDALVLSLVNPPYTDVATGKIEGRVTLYNLKDDSCDKCSDLDPLISQIKSSGVSFSAQKNVSSGSDEGKALIAKYKLDFVPALILSKDAAAYDIIQKVWPQIGSKETDGSYVLRTAYPPFINLTTGKLRGPVSIIYLTDKSCSDCYNVNLHKQILTGPGFAMKLDKEETIDVSDGRGNELLAKYNITQVPTVILSDEAQVYPSSFSLKQFFSVEKDGSYIFRKLGVLGPYKDLIINQVVRPQQQSQGQQ